MDLVTSREASAAEAAGATPDGGRAALRVTEEARKAIRARTRAARASASDARGDRPTSVASDVEIPAPPFWGSRVVAEVPVDEVFAYVNEAALFKGQWQIRQGTRTSEEYRAYLDETVRPVLDRLKAECRETDLLSPQVVYGYFPCHSDGDDLIVYGEDRTSEIARFTFPRQPGGKRLCLADYFSPRAIGQMDVAAFHLVTVGPRATEHAQSLFAADNYSEYLYFHGLAVETAEALAEYWHKRIREELGIAGEDALEIRKLLQQQYRGARYSFGYPACPNLEDQALLFKLLSPERIGVSLTEEFQLVPEQSTSAIIVHHPAARYFAIE
jgi:5-methyltetrahydrofolate--homocysteine methyltransferase